MFNKIFHIWITEKEKIRSQWDHHKKFKLGGEGGRNWKQKKNVGREKGRKRRRNIQVVALKGIWREVM